MNRREFFFSWIVPQRNVSVPVEVMEVFSAASGPSAFLVHHVSEATRDVFAEWLRTHSGATVVCRLQNGAAVRARIFRVRMCFGRGLILTQSPVPVRTRDVLSIDQV